MHGMTHIITYMRLKISFCLHGIYVFITNMKIYNCLHWFATHQLSRGIETAFAVSEKIFQLNICMNSIFGVRLHHFTYFDQIATDCTPLPVSVLRYTHTRDYHWYIFLFILWLLPLNRIETPFFSRNSMRIRWMSWLNIVRQCSSFIIRAVCMIFIIFRFFACAYVKVTRFCGNLKPSTVMNAYQIAILCICILNEHSAWMRLDIAAMDVFLLNFLSFIEFCQFSIFFFKFRELSQIFSIFQDFFMFSVFLF